MSKLTETYPEGRTFYYEDDRRLAPTIEFLVAMERLGLKPDIVVNVPADKLDKFEAEGWQVGT